MNQERLLEEIFREGKDDIAAFGADVAHQLDEGPVIVNVPEQVGKENQEGGETTEPYPASEEDTPLSSEHKSDDHAEAEEGNGIFFLEADAGDHTETEPVTRGFFSSGAFDG